MIVRSLFGLGLALGISAGAQAAVVFNLTEFTGGDAAMKVTVTQGTAADADKLKFTVAYVAAGSNTIGDLRGIFFQLANESLIGGFSLIGANVGLCDGPANGVTSCGSNSNNITGGGGGNPGAMDIGIEIGSQGIGGGDDFQSISFTLDHSSVALNVNTFFGSAGANTMAGRVMSLGNANGRGDSSKLKGGPETVPEVPVPEPATLALFGAGLLGLGMARRRRSR